MNVQNVVSPFDFRWNLKDGYPAKNIKKHGLKVFSTFACGGGSTMGYKLAGFDVIAANDIDPQMQKVYVANHNPKQFYLCPVKDLLTKVLPKELYELDVLDGSPPCSAFSMAGEREKNWGKKKKFREGQSAQVLNDLFFDFIDLVEKLKPKVVVAENVKGMLQGKAMGYCIMVQQKLHKAGYNVQLFLLNAATMGVPQVRERVFFIATRQDLNLPKIKLIFNFKQIPFMEISDNDDVVEKVTKKTKEYYENAPQGKPVGKFDSIVKVNPVKPLQTITATNSSFHSTIARPLNKKELILGGSFPLDYNFLDCKPNYLIGMSVPPVMMAQIANQIYLQFFNK